jgi:hypothetical protein
MSFPSKFRDWQTPFAALHTPRQQVPTDAVLRDALQNKAAVPQAPAPTSSEQIRRQPQAGFEPGRYGDAVSLLVPLAAGVSLLALPRPRTTRVLLIVANPTLQPLYFSFGQSATLGSMPIPAGSSLFLDAAVPQNDMYLFSAVGGNIPVQFINTDIANAVAP